MSLEQAMTDLAAAIREQTEVIKSTRNTDTSPASPAEPAKIVKKTAPAKVEKPAPADEEEDTAADEVPYEKVQKAVVALADGKGKPAVKAILAKFKVDHAKNLDAAKRPALIKALEDALNAEDEDDLA